jgi:hypothetical protein
VLDDMMLESVKVYAYSAGTRKVELRDVNGTVLQSKSFNLAIGVDVLDLNFQIGPGNYELGLDDNEEMNLFRNSSGATYPYELPGVVTITGNTANASSYYYFFYDWVVKGPDCHGDRFPVEVIVDTDPNCNPWYTGLGQNDEHNALHIYPNPNNGIFNISFELIEAQNLSIGIFDVNGQQVIEALNERRSAGQHKIEINGANLEKGLYFVRFNTDNSSEIKKLILN